VSPIGVISNPRSHRNRRHLAAVMRAAAALPEGRHRLLEDMADLPAILADFAAAGVRLLVINGGDGTVQAVFTEIFNDGPFAAPPAFAILSGGMTNMIADDVGLRGRHERELAHLGRALREDRCEVLTRRLIRCEATPGARPLHGMFFGAAAICRAILACRASVHPLHIEAQAAAGVTIAGLLLRRLLRGGRNDPVFRGERIAVQVDDEPAAEGAYLLLLATTLDRLVLGSRPYWGQEAGGLRFTSIAHPPPHLVRALWPVLTGRPPAGADGAYVSRNVHRVSLAMDGPWTLDGEMFEARPERPVLLQEGAEVRFLRPQGR
jgi:hypothetical protein